MSNTAINNNNNGSKKSSYRANRRKKFVEDQDDDLEWGTKNPAFVKNNSFPESQEYRTQSVTNSAIKGINGIDPRSPLKIYKNLGNQQQEQQQQLETQEKNQQTPENDQQPGFFGRIMNKKMLVVIIIAVIVILVIAVVGFVFAFLRYKRNKKKDDVKVLEEKNIPEEEEDESDDEVYDEHHEEKARNKKDFEDYKKKTKEEETQQDQNKNKKEGKNSTTATLYVPKPNEMKEMADKQRIPKNVVVEPRFVSVDEDDNSNPSPVQEKQSSKTLNTIPKIEKKIESSDNKQPQVPEIRNPSKVLKDIHQKKISPVKVKKEVIEIEDSEEKPDPNARQTSQNSAFTFMPVNNDKDELRYLNIHKKKQPENESEPSEKEIATATYLNSLRNNNDSQIGVVVQNQD